MNSNNFPPSGPWKGCFPAGSLLYTAAKIQPHMSPVGIRTFDVTHFFEFIGNVNSAIGGTDILGHNFYPALVTGKGGGTPKFGWVELSTDGKHHDDSLGSVGYHVFDGGPMEYLFRPPYTGEP